MLLLAEALGDPEALAIAHIQMGLRYPAIGAPVSGMASAQTAIAIVRDHDLPGPLARALVNLAAASNSRNLPAALAQSSEAIEVSRRAGLKEWTDYATLNHLIALWTAGRYADARRLLPEAHESTTDPSVQATLVTIEGWLCDATGAPAPDSVVIVGDFTDDESTLAWVTSNELTLARLAGDHSAAADLAAATVEHLRAAAGIEDDFCVLWPPTGAHVPSRPATSILPTACSSRWRVPSPVSSHPASARSGTGSVAWSGPARGADPSVVEADLRAGVEALGAFGAVGERARAQEELARWLVEQDRAEDAAPLVVSARETYAEIGAEGWLARLDAWQAGRLSDTRPAP